MYYPIQIPYILQKEFSATIDYSEKCIPSLANFVICFWQMLPKTNENCQINNIIVTDGCVDLVVDFDNKLIGYAGMSKTDFNFAIEMPNRLFGARLVPGAFQQLTGVPAKAVMDNFLAIESIDKTFDQATFFSLSFAEAQKYFIAYFYQLTATCFPNEFSSLFSRLYDDIPETALELSQRLHFSPKQCQRLFAKHFGITPKKVLTILRFQKALNLLVGSEESAVEILNATNYYDQPHFIKDFKRNIGLTPLELIEKYRK